MGKIFRSPVRFRKVTAETGPGTVWNPVPPKAGRIAGTGREGTVLSRAGKRIHFNSLGWAARRKSPGKGQWMRILQGMETGPRAGRPPLPGAMALKLLFLPPWRTVRCPGWIWKPVGAGGKAERSEQMKKSLVAVFVGVLLWFGVSNATGVGKITIYNVSDFIAPFYVQLGDIILYLLFGTLIYTTGIFVYHLHVFQECRKSLNGKSEGVRNLVRNLFRKEPEAESAGEAARADRLWETVRTEKDSPYGEVFQGLSEEDLKSRQDFVHALEVRVGDMTAQKKQVLSFYNYISITAPTLGFLGTAVGMVAIFDDVGVAGAEQLAADLKIALITTVVGLGIRFVALFCKTFLESLQDDLSIVMVNELKEMLA